MLKNYEYRLYPTQKQQRVLEQQLAECRWLYNHLLEQRKSLYEQTGRSLGLYDQQKTYSELKKARPSLEGVHSQVLENVAVRLDLAFKAFFRRLQAGEKPGFPRFRGAHRYDSLTFPQVPSGCSLDGTHLKLSKVGRVKIIEHRPLGGTAKTCTIRRSATGKWFATFACEVAPHRLPESAEQVGIDVGLESFAHLSTDERIANPRFFRQDEQALATAQRKLSAAEKGTKERTKRRKPVARIHERIGWRRKNFTHQESRKIVNRFGFMAVEDIRVNQMLPQHGLAKSISDAAWSSFFEMLFSKAAEAGRTAVKVNPAYTSQACAACGHREKKPLSVRWHRCACCGFECHRDLNASLNIKAVGLHSLRGNTREAPPLASA